MSPSALADVLPTPVVFHKPTTVKASVLHGPRDLRLENRILPDPAPHELQIAVKATGICGSDAAYYRNFRNGDLQAVAPLTLGHESSGVVVAIGEAVQGFQIGEKVALEVGVPCDSCRICRKGRYNLCPKMRFRSSAKSIPHFQGTLQDKINHPAKWCHKIPSHVSFEAAVMLEPLSVAIHSIRRGAVAQGDTVIVFGAGTIGLLVAAVAKVSGATTVMIADVDAGRVQYALHNGFANKGYVVPRITVEDSVPGKLEAARNLACEIVEITAEDDDDLEGADVTFDCTGKESCMQAGLFATRSGGKLVMVGMGTPIQTVHLSTAHLREIDIVGVFRYANTYAPGLKLLSSGLLPSLDQMITHRFTGLASAKEAFEFAGQTKDDNGKLVLKIVIEAEP